MEEMAFRLLGADHGAVRLNVRRDAVCRAEHEMDVVLGISKRDNLLHLAPHLHRRRLEERKRLQDGLLGGVVRGAASTLGGRLPVVAAQIGALPDADVVEVSDPVAHPRLRGQAELVGEQRGRRRDQLAALLDRRAAQHERSVVRQRDGRLANGPELAVEARQRVGLMVDRGRGDEYKIDIGIVDHVFQTTVVLHFREILRHALPARFLKIADGRHAEKRVQRAERRQMTTADNAHGDLIRNRHLSPAARSPSS